MLKIMVTNDDGIDAPGLRALIAPLAAIGEVYVAAPAAQQSTKSHAMDLGSHLVERRDIPLAREAYAIAGTPADSVEIALYGLGLRPDLVVAGINQGFNLSKSILLSGTLGAASEAFMQGLPAIAVSLDSFTEERFDYAAGLAGAFIRPYLARGLGQKCYLNINVPCRSADQIKGIRWAALPLGCKFHQRYRRREEAGRVYFDQDGYYYKDCAAEDGLGYDWHACKDGWVTVTPLGINFEEPLAERFPLEGLAPR